MLSSVEALKSASATPVVSVLGLRHIAVLEGQAGQLWLCGRNASSALATQTMLVVVLVVVLVLVLVLVVLAVVLVLVVAQCCPAE